ncbi:MAG: sugar-binding transcriptional regulator [Alphaproteobacteria bacterium]|nr:sugar-binding transcriptional regulator [Alphaproteobacteria bacterium]
MTSRTKPARRASGEDIIIEAAWMYYHDGLNQSDIAAALGISRATVVNYLQQARERGFIRITMTPEAFTTHEVAVALCEKFDLKSAYVLPLLSGGDSTAFQRTARGAAEWLPDLLGSGDRLGVSWGRTIYEVAEALEQTSSRDMTVVQLVGSMASPYGFTAEICSAHLAHRLGARVINLHAPAVLSNPDLAAQLRREPIIAAQIAALSHCNKAIFAAGSCNPDSHIIGSGVATLEDLSWYLARGATGVMCGRFIDPDGKPIPGPLDDRMIGIELENLLGLEMGLLVSSGEDKVLPMRAAINGGYVTHVATDIATARLLLADG